MKPSLIAAAAVVLLVASARAGAADSAAGPASARVDSMVKQITQMPTLGFTRSAAFCTAQHQPAGVPLDARLTAMVSALSTGSRNALTDIARTDPTYLQVMPMPSASETAAMDRRSDQMLASVQSAPAAACAKLARILDAQNPEFFKELVMKDFRQYEAQRTQHCATTPRPADCR